MIRSKIKTEIRETNVQPLSCVDEVVKYGKKGQGRKELIFYLKTNKPLTRTAAIKAYCYTCMGMCADGQADCGDKKCPLYPFMPYTSVMREAPKRKKRVLTDAHKKKLLDGRKKMVY